MIRLLTLPRPRPRPTALPARPPSPAASTRDAASAAPEPGARRGPPRAAAPRPSARGGASGRDLTRQGMDLFRAGRRGLDRASTTRATRSRRSTRTCGSWLSPTTRSARRRRRAVRRDVAVNPNDTEESIWAFLCEAQMPSSASTRRSATSRSRARLAPACARRASFAGRDAGRLRDGRRRGRRRGQFYADLYLGLYNEAKGDAAAREYARAAAARHGESALHARARGRAQGAAGGDGGDSRLRPRIIICSRAALLEIEVCRYPILGTTSHFRNSGLSAGLCRPTRYKAFDLGR